MKFLIPLPFSMKNVFVITQVLFVLRSIIIVYHAACLFICKTVKLNSNTILGYYYRLSNQGSYSI